MGASYSEKSGHNIVHLLSSLGKVAIHLNTGAAPRTTALVLKAAQANTRCTGCRFYRNEAAPQAASFGPPYGLLQGSLGALPAVPPLEGAHNITSGSVCQIAGTRDFFIAVAGHPEWIGSFTVWGQVPAHDMATTVAQLVARPYHELAGGMRGRRRLRFRWLPAACKQRDMLVTCCWPCAAELAAFK
ncbi:hypothetical protein WJX81_003118 [Elliptochloris bilobata]|uniref:Peptidylprolyl isomerase n=1 Tax=Elliptochloris bilobata TaxID=381761 RepID=A0AAW1RCV1_9CHLO